MPETIHILVIEHPHGVDVWAHKTAEGAKHSLARYCKDWWDDVRDRDEERFAEPPEDEGKCIKAYFNALEDTSKAEHWEIRAVELED